MSLFFLLNPKQFGGVVKDTDTSDILDVYRKKRRRQEEALLEEEIAAQLLKARQEDIVLPPKVDTTKLSAILKSKIYDDVRQGEVVGQERVKRIRYLLLALALDD